jgi:hypothetical protein
MVINSGKPRSLADNLRLSGRCGEVTKNDLATLRAMLGRGGDTSLTASEAASRLQAHRDAIAFAGENLPQVSHVRGISTGETRAVIARAYYTADRLRLEAFCRVLRTSIGRTEADRYPIMLRDHLRAHPSGGRSDRVERYQKTERALRAFLRGETLVKLCAIDAELFPLPGEPRN